MSRPAQVSCSRLEEICGAAYVSTNSAEIAMRDVCGAQPSVIVSPGDAAQIGEVLRYASAEKLAVIPTGGCTKLGIGSRSTRYDIALDLSRLNRVLAYDPNDLTLGVEPGVRIADLMQILAEKRQFLPLAVPFMERATIGGVVAANSSSPLRHAYGAARDFCLGMEFVTADGAQAKSGGRVVKNVTGYDLHKALIGSLGTLAVITRVNFRTFPMTQAQGTFVASFPSAEAAFDFCRAVSHSVLTPQMMEVANPGTAALIFSGEFAARLEPRTWNVIVSAAGQPAVVERHEREFGQLAGAADAEDFLPLSAEEAGSALAQIREFPRLMLERDSSALIFRINAIPAQLAPLVGRLRVAAVQHELDFVSLARAAGILYAAFLPPAENSASPQTLARVIADVFHTCTQQDTQVTALLEWCPAELKTSPDVVWGPARPDFALMRRVKNSFDPQTVLAPGRFAGGI
jgi:glycolate oxidase FAD binding subunit